MCLSLQTNMTFFFFFFFLTKSSSGPKKNKRGKKKGQPGQERTTDWSNQQVSKSGLFNE